MEGGAYLLLGLLRRFAVGVGSEGPELYVGFGGRFRLGLWSCFSVSSLVLLSG